MEIPFVGGAYEGRSKSLNAQQSINLFPVIDSQEAKAVVAMYGTPGTTEFSDTSTASGIRGMHVMGDYLYAVVNSSVFRINSSGTATSLGVITTTSGHVGLANNGGQMLIVDGTMFGHIVTSGGSGTLADITDEDFPSSIDCVFYDGFLL